MTSYIAGKKLAPESLGSVLIVGLGKSGLGALDYCLSLLGTRVNSVFVAAGAYSEQAEASLKERARDGLTWAFGDDGLDCGDGALDRGEEQQQIAYPQSFDICIVSPGIPYWHPLYTGAQALSYEVISEVEFAWRESAADSQWVAITGTNGKTTTTSLAAALLQQAGFQAKAVGNIGDVCIEAVAAGETNVYVAEVSSYQLASAPGFKPNVAALLNITPDHLHWHKTFEAYRDAKLALFDHLAPGGVAIKSPDEAGFVNDAGNLVALGHELCATENLLIKGQHNVENALVAAAIAVALGAPDGAIIEGLKTFAPLEHRMEPAGTVNGVVCINDSKATNVDSTLKALVSYPGKNLWVLLGGDDKGTELSALVEATFNHCLGAVCYGAAGPRFHKSFAALAQGAPEGFQLLQAPNMEGALNLALNCAAPGDVVLLSPACASFDEFKSFNHRGEVFKELVAGAQKGCGPNGQGQNGQA